MIAGGGVIRLRFLAWAASAVAVCCICASIAHSETVTYEVVPPSWITPDGVAKHYGGDAMKGREARAFVFPSVGPQDNVSQGPVIPTLASFFARDNDFRSNTFRWPRSGTPQIVLSVTRRLEDATIRISADSEAAIRRLSWMTFQRLQSDFVAWLFKHTNCGIFVDCESRFSKQFRRHLITLWTAVLSDATFGPFAAEHLNLSRPVGIAYSGTVTALQQEGGSTGMFVTRLVPGQKLVVTWGNDNLYPSSDLSKAYSRITSGGSSEFRVVSDGGMRVFPRDSCKMGPVFQQNSAPARDVLTPIPAEWTPLVNTEFVPVYNLFDLSSSVLLSKAGAAVDCTGTAPAPKYIFLLTPRAYLKADPGGPPADVAQFENEARAALFLQQSEGTARQDLLMLARQFFLVGCDSADPKIVEAEWNHLLEIGFNLLRKASGDGSPRACGLYVNALFTGKSFIEVRNTYSMDGRLVEGGARNLETVGQVFAAGFAARINREGVPASPPLLEIFRMPDQRVSESTGATAIRLRFYTTVSSILDQIYVSEGDEIHARFVPEDLR